MQDIETNLYALIGVPDYSDKDTVRQAFRKVAREYHPDSTLGKPEEERQKLEEQFKRLNNARYILENPQTKNNYDQLLRNINTTKEQYNQFFEKMREDQKNALNNEGLVGKASEGMSSFLKHYQPQQPAGESVN